MMRFLALILFISIPVTALGQQQQKDTTSFYKDLYRYSKERKLLYGVYRAVFNVPRDPVNVSIDKRDNIKRVPDSLEGKIIRSIAIMTFEPFGASLHDTMSVQRSFLQKTGNALHVKSQLSGVRHYLLFEEGQPLDLFAIAESERLLRQSEFIRDAVIMAYPVFNSSDSVDVKVFARDLWTFELSVTVTTAKTRVRFTEYNFLGFGHRFRNKIEYDNKETEHSPLLLDGSYLVPNIGKTYIAAGVNYQFSHGDDKWGVFADRPFYSAVTNWAGGISYSGRSLSDSIRFFDAPFQQYSYVSHSSGIWAGRSFRIRRGASLEEQSTRLVLSTGFTRTRYNDVVAASNEVIDFFAPVDRYLVSLGYSNRRYFTDRYIYDFGEKEDVPSGRILQVTAGYEKKGIQGRIYTGFSVGGSGYIGNSGFLSAQTGFGTFYNERKISQGVFSAELFVFSRLFHIGNWRARWFGYTSLIYGVSRLGNETISLVRNEGIPGYKYDTPYGTSRFTLSIRALFFNPFELIGFRFTPILFAGIGMVGDDNIPVFKSTIYPGFGGGFAISNVHLIKSDFELLIGFYPVVPGTGNFETRINPYDFWRSTYRDYSFGRPDILPFE